ncbi:MAG: hypothetical protein J5750_09080 [Clostridiales bacterium]|nr:hypothetical protein [Clostridiales bacterium]
MLRKSHRLACLLLSFSLLPCMAGLSACDDLRPRKIEPSASTTLGPPHSATTEPTTTEEPAVTPTPDPDPDHAAMAEAMELAAKHCIPEEDLRGRYDLFVRFCRNTENNGRLGEFADYVYLLFPLIADHIEPESEDYFLAKVASLKIQSRQLKRTHAGEYDQSDNTVTINTLYLESDDLSYQATVMHELIHFVDTTIDGPVEKATFTVDHAYPINDVPKDQQGSLIGSSDVEFLVEGGAELYLAKYFTHYARHYTPAVQFLTGLEYLCGSDLLDDAFFSHDSAYVLSDFLISQGFTPEELICFYTTMYAMCYWKEPTGTVLRPEDVLIRLYENIRGSDFREDPAFCYILYCIYDEDFDFDKFPSPNEEFLKSNLLSYEEGVSFLTMVLTALPDLPELDVYGPPLCCLFIDGKLQFAIEITLTGSSDDDAAPPHVALVIDYDFDTGVSRSYEIFTPPLVDKNG